MKALFVLFCCVVASLVFVTASVADPGNGAVVIREEVVALYWYGEWDGEDMLLLGGSSEDALEAFHCGEPPEGEIFPVYDKLVVRPNGTVNLLEKASVYVRVFAPATPDDFNADPCGFLTNGPQVAEGIGRFIYNDNDLDIGGPGRNTWGYREGGPLYDLMGLCPNEIVHYKIIRRFQIDPVGADFPDCLPDDCSIITKVAKGPRLSCKEY